MRLTVHHSDVVVPAWQHSLQALLAAFDLSEEKARRMGKWHLATFNERVVGLSITEGAQIVFFAVRDLTRRRGIGRYLMQQTIRSLENQHCTECVVSAIHIDPVEKDGLFAFLQAMDFHQQSQGWSKSL